MAIQSRTRIFSQQRLTVPTIRAIESASSADWDSLLRNLVIGSTQPYIVNGFSINIGSSSFIQTAPNLTLNSLGGTILNNTAIESGTLLSVTGFAAESLSSTNFRVVGSFVANSTNYLAINYIRYANTNSVDTVYIFDATSGVEIPKQLPVSTILDYQLVITQNGFGTNVPIATIVTNSSNVPTSIVDSRYLLFRLGTGGAAPNPFNNYSWPQGRVEPPITSTSASQNPFSGGDKGILTMKNFFDAIMTSLKEIKGTPVWYSLGGGGTSSGLSLNTINNDANLSWWTGSGTLMHDPAVLGQLDSSQDIYIRSAVSDAYFHVQSFTKTMSTTQTTLYVGLNRYQALTGNSTIVPSTLPSPSALNTAAGGNTGLVIQAAAVGQFTGLNSVTASSDGDFIKSQNDSDRYFRQIEAFYDSTGALNTAANASYILLDSAYNITGASTGTQQLEYNTCYYANSAVTVSSKVNILNATAIQNVYWLANFTNNIIYVHGNIGYLVQGEGKNVNDPISTNLISYIGASSEGVSNPTYSNTINGAVTTTSQTNYGGTATDNLAVRTSLITTAAADQAQNKNISILGGGTLASSSGNLVWNASVTIIINGPGIGVTNYIPSNSPTGIGLAPGTCLWVNIQRDTPGASLNVSNTTYANVPLGENTFVIARAHPLTTDMIIGIDGGGFLLSIGSSNVNGFVNSASGSGGGTNSHKWRQERPTVNIAPINSVNVSMTPFSNAGLLVFRNGLVQNQGVDYNVVNQAVTFTYTLKSTDEIVAMYPVGKTISYNYAQEVPTGTVNSINTNFTISQTIASAKSACVFLNGLQRQYTTDFTISGQQITFTFAPPTGSTVYLFYTTSNDNIYADQALLGTTPNGTNQLFTFYEDISEINSTIVSVDGVCQFAVNNVAAAASWTIKDYYWLSPNGIIMSSTGWGGAAPPTGAIMYLFSR